MYPFSRMAALCGSLIISLNLCDLSVKKDLEGLYVVEVGQFLGRRGGSASGGCGSRLGGEPGAPKMFSRRVARCSRKREPAASACRHRQLRLLHPPPHHHSESRTRKSA